MITTQTYFTKLAKNRSKSIFSQYYWNEIKEYCYYFSHPSNSVLEIGCGSGDLLAHIEGSKKVGIDFCKEQINWAKEKHKATAIDFKVMDASNIQLNERFDLIILSNVIGFLPDIQLVFEQLHKVSHSNTKIIVQYYNSLWEPVLKLTELLKLKPQTPIQNWLSNKDVNNLLTVSGFDVYRNAKRFVFPIYIPLLSEFMNVYLAKFPPFRFLTLNTYSFAKPSSTLSVAHQQAVYSTTVVIPARNESGNIENAILQMPQFGKHIEIIFVEGNSTDDTWNQIQIIAQKYKHSHDIKYIQQPGKGKGDAVRAGYKIATGDILMILDADLTVPPADLVKFYDVIATHKADFINGTRLVYPMNKGAMRFLNLIGNYFFSWAFTWLLEQRFKDTLCGTKVMFKKDYLKLIDNRAYFGDFDPFGDFDLLFGAHKLNLKILEIPIRYKDRTYGETNISRFKHGLILLKMCLFASRKCKFK